MKLAVCDDVKEDADITLKIVKNYFNNKATDVSYLSPNDLLYEIDNGEFIYDIIILDIDYKNCNYNGIELGKKINDKYPLCNIIYLTGILDFASDVYETNHCYFVMKKISVLHLSDH